MYVGVWVTIKFKNNQIRQPDSLFKNKTKPFYYHFLFSQDDNSLEEYFNLQ